MKQFLIESYEIRLGETFETATVHGKTGKSSAIIRCYGESNGESCSLEAVFLKEGSPVLTARKDQDERYVWIYLKPHLLPVWIDVLRNEQQVFAQISDDVEKSQIFTK